MNKENVKLLYPYNIASPQMHANVGPCITSDNPTLALMQLLSWL